MGNRPVSPCVPVDPNPFASSRLNREAVGIDFSRQVLDRFTYSINATSSASTSNFFCEEMSQVGRKAEGLPISRYGAAALSGIAVEKEGLYL